tara:strand:+ start:20 stop:811 length:792 start_codon:yes stop_codon:yes gene_type:complete
MILILKNILGILTDPKNIRMFLLGGIVVLLFLLLRQCGKTEYAKEEATRFQNNLIASNDTIRNYVNAKGESVGEIKGLSLSLEELRDSLDYEKGRPPITIIKYKTIIEEKIIEVQVKTKDTLITQGKNSFNSILSFTSSNNWQKSSRSIDVDLPYSFTDSLTFGSATISLKQNIWLDATLSQDIKSKEIFIKLTSDYPGTTFNSAQGIMIDRKSAEFKSLQMQNRKQFGLGINIGMGISYNGTLSLGPYIGLGVSWNPKFLQW